MSYKKLRPFIVKVSVLGYFPLCVFSEISSILLSRDNRGRFLGWGRFII